MNQSTKTPDYVVELAKDLRNNMTESEKKLWSFIRRRQIDRCKFRCQHPIYRYILDFYCPEKQLAIEIDGDIHNSQQEYDRYRYKFLNGIGIRTLRLKNEDVLNNIEKVIEIIKIKLSK